MAMAASQSLVAWNSCIFSSLPRTSRARRSTSLSVNGGHFKTAEFAVDASDGHFPRLDVQVRSLVFEEHAEQIGQRGRRFGLLHKAFLAVLLTFVETVCGLSFRPSPPALIPAEPPSAAPKPSVREKGR